ncbi:TonB-dependent receptor family protein [Panacagrimonas sp.]|uniref:TonB-dependent receptor family protein n=1 Tax=Panacagrimonas sp. TaxID=2480088 RepID=UPI003B52A087
MDKSWQSARPGVAGGAFGLGLALAAVVPVALSQTDAAELDVQVAPTTETVTVTATRVSESAFEIPASIDVIGGEAFNDGTLGVNLSEGLGAVPGMLARDRQNYAQDTQISIRGFGSRATFGIRGVRLYLDGIPATQPDGSGQVSHFNLATADRVEILRGPFSTLYGNSSGGVIQMFTADGTDLPRVSGGLAAGSFGTLRANIGTRGKLGIADYNLDYTHFETDGFRDHSEAERESFNSKVNFAVGGSGRLSLVLNYFDSPDVLDPQGLTREQFEQDPSSVAPQPVQFNTRKSVEQSQVGAVYSHDLGAGHELRVAAYGGNRRVEQFLSVPPGAQASPFSQGGVIDLDSDYVGTDARWSWRDTVRGRPFTVVAGLTYDDLSQDRLAYENFIGDTLGVRGALRRDEVNDIDNFDQYLQVSLDPHPRWNTMVGVRRSKVKFDSADRYIVGPNGDDSGKADFSETTPVAGALFRLSPQVHLYGAYGRGFETPTFVELAYRPDGSPGLNFDLDAAVTDNTELGAKFRIGPNTRSQIAVFHADTEDELVVATNSGGRSTFQNAGKTRRQGVELLTRTVVVPNLSAQVAMTWLEAEVREGYLACTGTPCTEPATPVEKGNRLPGIPEWHLFAALNWGAAVGWQAGVEARYLDAVPVNDVNAESAPSYHLVTLDGGYVFRPSWGRLHGFVRVENLFDEEYVGSVIVNDGNGRFYEPGPERNVLVGVRMDWDY